MFLEKTSRQCGARMGGDTQNPNTPETSGMESGLGKSPTPQPYPHPLPHKAWKSSFPGKGPDWMASRQPVPGCQRGHPPPTRHTSFSPPPAPADAAVHTLDLLLFSVLSPSPSGRACSLAGTCCLLVGASIAPYLHSVSLCQGQTTQGLDASQGQPESLHPTARVAQPACHPCPTVGCTQAKGEVRASPASMQGVGEQGLSGVA